MCGIIGLWRSQATTDLLADEVERMAERVAARGPDGKGLWADEQAGVCLGHRRLSIVDPSMQGSQPMLSHSGRYVISFNGEVFNYLNLRRELEAIGAQVSWRGKSDTEVLLAAVEKWGVRQAVERLVGMFAFAVWDRRERKLWLARDRFGIKPLSYARLSGGLAFASEARAFRPLPDFDDRLNEEAIASYFQVGYVAGSRCIYAGARKVMPGSILVFSEPGGEPEVDVYWDTREVAVHGFADPFEGSAGEAAEELGLLVREAVQLATAGDFQVGVLLSGGIDSSLIAVALGDVSDRSVQTFSAENADAEYDESTFARIVATQLGMENHTVSVSPVACAPLLSDLPEMYDEPFADSSQIPTAMVSRLARKSTKVVLAGDGGDEVFGGYNRYVAMGWVELAQRFVPCAARRVIGRSLSGLSAGAVDKARGARSHQSESAAILLHDKMYKLRLALDSSSAQEAYERLRSQWPESSDILHRARVPKADRHWLVKPSAAAMMLEDMMEYLPDDLLTKLDRASMGCSLEARVPLLDHRLVDFAWRLPLSMKIRRGRGKWIVRRYLGEYLPKVITRRRKMGFGIPIGKWLRNEWRPWAQALLSSNAIRQAGYLREDVVARLWEEHSEGRRDWGSRLWTVLMFQAWLERNSQRPAAERR